MTSLVQKLSFAKIINGNKINHFFILTGFFTIQILSNIVTYLLLIVLYNFKLEIRVASVVHAKEYNKVISNDDHNDNSLELKVNILYIQIVSKRSVCFHSDCRKIVEM